MIDTSIPQSPISCESASYILGLVSNSLTEFNRIESVEIVRSLFGVQAEQPEAIDITEAIDKSLNSKENSDKLRSVLQDRGVGGVIWRFTSSKKFMIELSKVLNPKGNFLSLSLIMLNVSQPNDIASTTVRELVRFGGKTETKFMDKRIRSIDYSVETSDLLKELHEESIRKLESKYLKKETVEETKPVQKVEPPKVVKPEEPVKNLIDKNIKINIVHNGIWADEIYSNVKSVLEEGIEVTQIAKIEERLKATHPEWDWQFWLKSDSLEVSANVPDSNPPEEPEPEKAVEQEPPVEPESQTEEPEPEEQDAPPEPAKEEWSQEEPSSPNEPVTVTLIPESSPEFPPEADPDDYQDELTVIMEGVIVNFKVMNDDEIAINLNGTDETLTTFADADFKDLIDTNVAYRAQCNISSEMLRDKTASEILELFSVFSDEQKPEETTNVEVQQEDIKPQTKEETMKEPVKITVSEKYVDIKDDIILSLDYIVTHHPKATNGDLTFMLREELQIDELGVRKVDDGYEVYEAETEVDETAVEAEPAIPSIDIRNIANQTAMITGLFGVAEPAITHVEKFLRNHLTEEHNANFLASQGTIPTEVTIIYNEKPYDITYCIMKMKDGRYYRVWAAITDPSLEDHGWVATKDIPNRWVKLRDIQNTAFKNDFRNNRRF